MFGWSKFPKMLVGINDHFELLESGTAKIDI